MEVPQIRNVDEIYPQRYLSAASANEPDPFHQGFEEFVEFCFGMWKQPAFLVTVQRCCARRKDTRHFSFLVEMFAAEMRSASSSGNSKAGVNTSCV